MREFTVLNDLFAAIELGEMTPVQLKGPTFGKKQFFQATLNGRSVWAKKYPDVDMPMILTGDADRRELEFVRSNLPAALSTTFQLPYIGVSPSRSMLAMFDVSEELQRFGPPNLPTAVQMQTLVQALARKDALEIEKCDWMAAPESPFLKMKEIVLGLESGTVSEAGALCRELWPWMQTSLDNLRQKRPQLYALLLKVYDGTRLDLALASLPGSLQHGDFYFSNIGFDDAGRPVVIDWETVTYGPPGLDLAMLIDGMPPLPFIQEITGWYLTEFNQNSRKPMTEAQLKQTMDIIGLRSLLVSGLIDLLRFALADNSPLPEPARCEMLLDFENRLLQADTVCC